MSITIRLPIRFLGSGRSSARDETTPRRGRVHDPCIYKKVSVAAPAPFFVCLLRDLLALKAVLPFNAVVAGGRKVAQSIGKVASLNERRRSEPEGGSIHADSTQLCHQYPWRRRGPGDATPAQGRRPGQPADRERANSLGERFGHVINKDEVFGTHNPQNPKNSPC